MLDISEILLFSVNVLTNLNIEIPDNINVKIKNIFMLITTLLVKNVNKTIL